MLLCIYNKATNILMSQLYRVSTYAPNVVHFARELPKVTCYTITFRNAERESLCQPCC